MSVHQLKDGRWFCKIPDPDKKSGSRREYFGRGDVAEAKARAFDRDLVLKRTRPKALDSGPTFLELAQQYVSAKNFTGQSAMGIKYSLGSAILPAIGSVHASTLTFSDMDKYVKNRLEKIKATSINREIIIIQAIMNWAVNRRPSLIPFNPLRGFSKPKGESEIFFPPTKEEINAILNHANERLRRFIIIAWYTGLRPGEVELLSLQWEAVSWETNTIRVTSARKGGVRSRDIPIHPDFLIELKKWKAADDSASITTGNIIYLGKKGRAIKDIHDSWYRAKFKAGITRRIRMYDLRHLFVTSAIESGADYKTVSEIVGSDPETLRRHYQHVSSAARQSVIEKMPSLSN
jgi:integrase